MIEKFVLSKNSKLAEIMQFIESNQDYDCYFTHDNTRTYITDEKSLKCFLRETICTYVYKENGNVGGLISVWKSMGGDVKRYYVKINAASAKIAQDLLTILTWNFNKELFIKIKKDSKFVEVFKYKSFRFIGGRGVQLLLQRKPNEYEYRAMVKEADID